MRAYLAELIAVPLLPLLLVQGRWTRARTPRLPEPDGERHGLALPPQGGSQAPLTLLAVGESPVAGVGVARQDQAITAQLAAALAAGAGRAVQWQALGRNGATVREAAAMLPALPTGSAAPLDVLLVAFGVNDAVAFRSVGQWQADMRALLAELERRYVPGLVVLSGVPPMREFPALPRPLRWVLGLKAAALDRGLQALANEKGHMRHVPLRLDTTSDASLAAEDGYHPSAKGCQAWASLLAAAITPACGGKRPGPAGR